MAEALQVRIPEGAARAAFERAFPGQVYLGAELALVGLVDELLALRRHAAALERSSRFSLSSKPVVR